MAILNSYVKLPKGKHQVPRSPLLHFLLTTQRGSFLKRGASNGPRRRPQQITPQVRLVQVEVIEGDIGDLQRSEVMGVVVIHGQGILRITATVIVIVIILYKNIYKNAKNMFWK